MDFNIIICCDCSHHSQVLLGCIVTRKMLTYVTIRAGVANDYFQL